MKKVNIEQLLQFLKTANLGIPHSPNPSSLIASQVRFAVKTILPLLAFVILKKKIKHTNKLQALLEVEVTVMKLMKNLRK